MSESVHATPASASEIGALVDVADGLAHGVQDDSLARDVEARLAEEGRHAPPSRLYGQ